MMVSSFRDPAGAVFFSADSVFRVIYSSGIGDYRVFQASRAATRLVASKQIVSARELAPNETVHFQSIEFAETPAAFLCHEFVEFPSYPYEWPPQMLAQAGLLTLDIAETLLEEGLALKDATPFNILFRGPNPIFVDWLSVERRNPSNALWLAKAQFERTFVLPLLAAKYFGLGLDQVFIPYRDGLTPESVRRQCGFWQALNRDFLFSVSLPVLLGGKSAKHRVKNSESERVREARNEKNRRYSPDAAKFIVGRTFTQLRGQIQRLGSAAIHRDSLWAEYDNGAGYSSAQAKLKQDFVQRVIERLRPQRVLDIGSNTGCYSEICARSGARVVAIDSDLNVVDRLYRNAREKELNILPLHVNFARPSPSIGWHNEECSSFLDRAYGVFDGVLMLAVLHHLLITERIPLRRILELAAAITRDFLIIEFVGNRDPMFRDLARYNERHYEKFSQDLFESECNRYFEIRHSEQIDGTDRRLYLCGKRREIASAAYSKPEKE